MTKNEERINKLFKELVPETGKADSLAGELVRAMSRSGYRFYNDGDQLGIGYGKETCNPAGRFLGAKGNDKIAKLTADAWAVYSEEAYEKVLDILCGEVADYVEQNPDLRNQPTEDIHKVNNKQQDKHIEAQVWGEASDKTPVYAADVIVTYQVLPEKSAWLYANVSDIKNLVGDELVASAIKSAMAELDPNEVTNRTKIEPLAQQKLAESLVQKYGEDVVFVNKVVINDMNFEDAYNEAIQQKSIAQQNADKQKIENEAAIAKAEADKQVAITNAEAEAQKTSIAADAQAEANRKLAESLSDTLIEYQKIQKWDGKLPTVSGSNALVSIDPAE